MKHPGEGDDTAHIDLGLSEETLGNVALGIPFYLKY